MLMVITPFLYQSLVECLSLWNSLPISISNSEILLEYFFKPLRELYTQLLF